MVDALQIIVKQEAKTLEGIKQFYVPIENERIKFDVLMDLYTNISTGQAIIYCNEKQKVDYLVDKFSNDGYTVGCIHSNLDSSQRRKIMKSFKHGETRILISTDLLARGIDVQQISLVINYDIPYCRENYIHRIGRSGRFGRKGLAINLVCPSDRPMFNEICQFYNTQIEELTSDLSDICT